MQVPVDQFAGFAYRERFCALTQFIESLQRGRTPPSQRPESVTQVLGMTSNPGARKHNLRTGPLTSTNIQRQDRSLISIGDSSTIEGLEPTTP